MIKLNFPQKISLIFLLFFLIFYFFYGFFIGENSAGGGGDDGDIKSTFKNLKLFVDNNILESIRLTTDHDLYYSNRPPLLYILHSVLNPFASDIEFYKRSVFFVSLLVPLFFYLSLKNKFKKVNDLILICLSFLIFLSPYFRTSSYWGLEENYPFITLFLTFIFLKKFFFKKNFFYLSLFIFFSSVCVYFDQKFIIIPMICFFLIIFSKIDKKYKIYSAVLYILFSIPFVYLIKLWGNITPVGNMNIYQVGNRFHPHHICYMVNIFGFYMFPFLFLLTKNKIKEIVINNYKKKKNLFFLSIVLLYLIYFLFFLNIDPSYNFGGGYSYKIAFFLFKNSFSTKILLSVFFIFSFVIILIFINDNYINALFIIFFILSSILINPLLHEYVDPLIFVFFFTFSESKINLNVRNIFFIFFYFLTILITAKIYYSNII
jgi:hypothetical protein